MSMSKTCPFAKTILPSRSGLNGYVNPHTRTGDHECTVEECKFNENGNICRIIATYDLERKNNALLQEIAKKNGITI
ncbi:hypothetical protein MKHDV_00091 [Halodesulfovibrio sp. MK-HDV]|nr:hypothetical protein MKHDV_00091 [Halodesulfovibrio sp. MK-HDV]